MTEILVVEDDLYLAQTLAKILEESGFVTQTCRRLSSAYTYLDGHTPELVLIDRMLPDGDGLELVEFLRDNSFKTKILILSQKAKTTDRIDGLAQGADDYLAKPFSTQELKLRINSLLNKTKHLERQYVEHGAIKIYPDENLIEIDQVPKKLRKKELDLFHCLLVHHDQVVTRQQLCDWLWGCKEETPTRTALDVYIKRLRHELGKYESYLKTIRGFGYQFTTPLG